jgi:hypothetical protein
MLLMADWIQGVERAGRLKSTQKIKEVFEGSGNSISGV